MGDHHSQFPHRGGHRPDRNEREFKMIYDLDKTVEKLDLRNVSFTKPEYGYYAETRRYLTFEGTSVTVLHDRYNSHLTLSLSDTNIRVEDIDNYIALLGAFKKIEKAYGKVVEAERAKRVKEQEERRKEYEKLEAERRVEREKEREKARKLAEIRAEKTKEREERLLNEFLDDEVRVRVTGYKSRVRAFVRSREVRQFGDEEAHWVPRLEYVLDQNWHWPTDIGSVVSFEVKVGGRFEEVWNDLEEGTSVVGRRSTPKRRRRRR